MNSNLARLKLWFSEKRKNAEPTRAWLALLASILTYFHVTLISASFGIIYGDLIEKYDSTRSDVGWAFSIYWMFLCVAGLVFSPFIINYGCKVVAFTGGLLFGAGLVLSAVAPNLGVFCLLYGCVTGFGSSCAFISGSAIIQQMFSENRGFATGMIAVGCSIGGIVHPFHTRLLLDTYGLFGILLIHGALSFNMILYSFAFKSDMKPRVKKLEKSSAQNDNLMMKSCGEMPGDTRAVSTISGCMHLDQTFPKPSEVDEKCPKADLEVENGDSPVMEASIKSQETSSRSDTTPPMSFKSYCLGITDFTPLKNVNFVLCSFHFLLLFTVRLGMTSHIVNAAIMSGIPQDQSAYLLSISAFGNLVARISASLLLNFSWMDNVIFSAFAALVLSASAFLPAYDQSYAAFAFSAVLVGIGDAISLGNFPLLIVQTLDLKKFTRGMSIAWALTVPAPIGATPFTGWLADRTGNYTLAFNVLGGVGIFSAVIAVFVHVALHHKKKKGIEPYCAPNVDEANR